MADLALIKKLRETTGCGIADCSKALKECSDSFENAVDWLRKKGLSSAGKKNRVTAEGAVGTNIQGNNATIIEVNSETDFVARNSKFQEFVNNILDKSFEFGSNVEKFKLSSYNSSTTIEEELKNQISIIGESIKIRRIDSLSVTNNGVVSSYIHNSFTSNLGKIAVIVALDSNGNQEKLQELGKKIAMPYSSCKARIFRH